MGWRFRPSFSPIPGVRVTLSASGLSTSVGAGPLRLSAGPRGVHLTGNLPGTGVSYVHRLDGGPAAPQPDGGPGARPPSPAPRSADRGPAPAAERPPAEPGLTEIASAGSALLTSPGLSGLQRALVQALRLRDDTAAELALAREDEEAAAAACAAWEGGWFWRRVRPAQLRALQAAAQEAEARRAELDAQLRLCRLPTQIEVPDGVVAAYARVIDAFARVALAERIWDTVGGRGADRARERTQATRVVDRRPVRFGRAGVPFIDCAWEPPRLGNANGGDLYLYPAFVVYFVDASTFALLEISEVQLEVERWRFHEEEAVPADAEVVGSTWLKTNKDGSPDRRFRDNRQIPVVQYARLVLRSRTGLHEEYLISQAEAVEGLQRAWAQLQAALPAPPAPR